MSEKAINLSILIGKMLKDFIEWATKYEGTGFTEFLDTLKYGRPVFSYLTLSVGYFFAGRVFYEAKFNGIESLKGNLEVIISSAFSIGVGTLLTYLSWKEHDDKYSKNQD